jgi:hypothetical protein
MLRFTDGTWMAAWLDPVSARMESSSGRGEPPGSVTAALANPTVPSASAPLDTDRPYANEPNDIAAEARKSHGQVVEGVAIGERDLSVRFRKRVELEGTVFPNAAGQFMLRVFWEQW